MSKLQLVPMPKGNLPLWKPPRDTDHAASIISELALTLHENAYLLGRTLIWVKEKEGPRKFDPWLKRNVKKFGRDTAYRMMRFATSCDEQQSLLEYHPRICRTVRQITQKQSSWDDADETHKIFQAIRKIMNHWPREQHKAAAHWIKQALKEFDL